MIQFTYSPAGDLRQLTDGRAKNTYWGYDAYGRVTSKTNHNNTRILAYQYDVNDRLTNRWSLGKGSTTNRYDAAGNLTNVVYPVSPALKFTYDKNNRLKSMIDGTGTSTYTYTDFGALLSEDGPWSDDVVSYAYDSGRRRQRLSVGQSGGTSWSQTYAYDAAGRLDALTAPEGTYDYQYHATRKLLVQKLVLPNGASITNGHDGLGRLTHTHLRRSDNTLLNRHDYVYNAGHQRTKQTRTDGDYVDYTYDNAGQVRSASGKESGGSNRLHEQFGYTYDAGGNLSKRTNNALIQTLTVDNLNQLSSGSRSGTLTVAGTTAGTASSVSVNGSAITPYADRTFARAGLTPANGNNTYTAIATDGSGRSDTNVVTAYLPSSPTFNYDDNGNLLTDGRRSFTYDDENQLLSVSVASAWKAEFAYDGLFRRRVRKEYLWQSGAWKLQEEVRYVYDGNLVLQERNGLGVPNVTYTRGNDLSGSRQGAGGIGGLLARTEGLTPAYYHADGNGNITALVNGAQWIAARYLYDPYGNTLAQSGALAEANLYRFSSKEAHPASGLSYYLYRYYDPNLQRWLNRDPIREAGGVNLFSMVGNNPIAHWDPLGLQAAGASWGGSSLLDAFKNNPNPSKGNCWRHACNDPMKNGEPHSKNPPGWDKVNNCAELMDQLRSSGAGSPLNSSGKCDSGFNKVSVQFSPEGSRRKDFHFARENPDGTWCDKAGSYPENNYDKEPKPLPGYTRCGYLCIKNGYDTDQ